jgi:hypothetical protein
LRDREEQRKIQQDAARTRAVADVCANIVAKCAATNQPESASARACLSLFTSKRQKVKQRMHHAMKLFIADSGQNSPTESKDLAKNRERRFGLVASLGQMCSPNMPPAPDDVLAVFECQSCLNHKDSDWTDPLPLFFGWPELSQHTLCYGPSIGPFAFSYHGQEAVRYLLKAMGRSGRYSTVATILNTYASNGFICSNCREEADALPWKECVSFSALISLIFGEVTQTLQGCTSFRDIGRSIPCSASVEVGR